MFKFKIIFLSFVLVFFTLIGTVVFSFVLVFFKLIVSGV